MTSMISIFQLLLLFFLFNCCSLLPFTHGKVIQNGSITTTATTAAPRTAASKNQNHFIIAHMTNSPGSVLWSLNQGVSAIELDLNYDQCGNLMEFYHDEPCGCTAVCPFRQFCPSKYICDFHWSETNNTSPCGRRTPAKEMINFLASPEIINRLSFIYIDNKIENTIPLFKAGRNLVEVLNVELIGKGYKGQILINALAFKNIEFLRGALDEANKSEFGDQYFYTLDENGWEIDQTRNALLTLRTPNIIFSHGGWKTYYAEMKEAVRNPGFLGRIVYTVDTRTEVEQYMDQGVNGFITNNPSLLLETMAKKKNSTVKELKTVTGFTRNITTILPKPDPSFSWHCDCKYHSKKNEFLGLDFGILQGGCAIEIPPPPGQSCNCVQFFWRCIGFNGKCYDSNSADCKYPSATKKACEFGGGNCNGYVC